MRCHACQKLIRDTDWSRSGDRPLQVVEASACFVTRWGVAMEIHPDPELSAQADFTCLINKKVSVLLGFSKLGQH